MAGKTTTLLATDIAARGIHVNRLSYVVNYDFPGSLDQYVHRCGRAGRGREEKTSKNEGEKKKITACVYSFFTRNMKAMAPDLLRLLRDNDEWIDPNLADLVEGSGLGGLEKSGSKKKSKKETTTKSDDDNDMIDDEGVDDGDDNDEFASLGKPQNALKRDKNVSSSDESEEEEEEEEEEE